MKATITIMKRNMVTTIKMSSKNIDNIYRRAAIETQDWKYRVIVKLDNGQTIRF